jgi:hypothetical protein
MSDKIQNYLRRYKDARANAERWMSTIQDAYKYAIPQQNLYEDGTSGAKGDKRGSDVYDSTLSFSLNRFVSRLSSGLTPAGTNWLTLVSGPDVPEEEVDDVNRKLEDATNQLFRYINRSNFNAAMNTCYKDWAIGTAALICNETEDDDNPLHFSCVPIDTVSPEYGPYGQIKTVWRKFSNFYARNILEQWPRATISDETQIKIDNDNNYKINIIEGTVWDNDKRSYNYIVMSEDGQETFLDEDSPSSPWVIFRYAIYRDEIFGRGIVLELMPEVKTLNKMREDYLKNSELAINPPLLAFGDSIANMHNIRFEPHSIIPVEAMGNGQPSIQQLQSASNYSLAQSEMDGIRAFIKSALFAEPLGPINSPTKTATEVVERMREVTESLEPAASLLQHEFGQPFVERVMYILQKRGLMTAFLDDEAQDALVTLDEAGLPVPRTQLVVDDKVASINFESPLTLSQGLNDASQFERAYVQLSQIYGQEMASLMTNVEEVPNKIVGYHGADPNLFKTGDEITELLSQAAAQAAEEAAQPQLPQQLLREDVLPTIPGGPI